MKRIVLILALLACPSLLWAQSYTPTVGISVKATGGRDVVVPARYADADGILLPFGYATTPGGTCTVGIPAIGTTFYECDFENATGAFGGHAATSVFDRFGVPWVILDTAATSTPGDKWDICYSTVKCISEDDRFVVLDTDGNADVRWFTDPDGAGGVTVGDRVAGYSFGTIGTSPSGEFRWMRGVHYNKLLYKEGNNYYVMKVEPGVIRWCTVLSPDALSDTCSATSETAYHVNPFGSHSIGGNEGDINATNLLPIYRSGPNRLDVYNVVAKTNVSMASVPSGSFDHAQISPDGAFMGAQIDQVADCNGTWCWFAWNAATGAIQNSGNPLGSTGHSGFGIKSDGTNVRVLTANFFGTNPCPDAARRDSQGTVPWTSTNENNANWTNLLCHASASSNDDEHFSIGQSYPSPLHYGIIFDENDETGVTNTLSSGALSTNWDTAWKYLLNEILWCDFNNPSGDPDDAPECVRLAHYRTFNDGRDCNPCVNLSATGQYILIRSHLNGLLSTRYIVRLGPLFTAGTVPTLTSVAPTSGAQGATVGVTLTGTNLGGASPSVSVSGSGVTVQNLNTGGAPTSWTADFVIAAGAAIGGRCVTVTTVDGTSGCQTFTVNAAVSAPTLSSISPTEGWHGAQITVVFTGTGLNAASPVLNSSCGGVTFPSHVVDSATQITAQVLIAAFSGAGGSTCNFSVTNVNGTSETRTFTVRYPGPVGSPRPIVPTRHLPQRRAYKVFRGQHSTGKIT